MKITLIRITSPHKLTTIEWGDELVKAIWQVKLGATPRDVSLNRESTVLEIKGRERECEKGQSGKIFHSNCGHNHFKCNCELGDKFIF